MSTPERFGDSSKLYPCLNGDGAGEDLPLFIMLFVAGPNFGHFAPSRERIPQKMSAGHSHFFKKRALTLGILIAGNLHVETREVNGEFITGQYYLDAPGSGRQAEIFPVQYSTLSSEALKTRILSKYAFHKEVLCEYLYRGLNDNYLVRDADSRFILRVYRHAWRNLRDIESEMEILQYLKGHGVSVSFPISDREGKLIQVIDAPEGMRYAVLFSYAKGSPPLNAITPVQARRAGRELAKMHTLTLDRRLKNNRCHLDVAALLYESYYAIKPFIEERQDDMKDFEEVVQTLRVKFEEISLGDLSFGICHGDFYPANYHVSSNDEVTLFDFDACCCSWFVMDVASFCYVSSQFYKNAKEVNKEFLTGYQEMRTLSKVEVDLIPYFGAVNYIRVLGTQCSNFEIFCHFVRTNIKRNIIKNLKRYVKTHCP